MIRVLYVDDEAGLLEIAKAFLEMSGELQVDTFLSVAEAEKGLLLEKYDAVVSDYQMPDISGIDFLKRLRSQDNNIPFILFTGRGREEVVIEALNSGADFYLQKGGRPNAQFTELEHKIRESVRKKMTEQELVVKKIQLQAAMHLAHIGYWSIDIENAIFTVDDHLWELFGTDAEKENGYQISMASFIQDFVHPEDAPTIREEFEHGIDPRNNMISGQIHYRLRKKDGTVRHVISYYSLTRKGDGRTVVVHGATQDVTDRVQAEISLGRMNRELIAIKEINKAIVHARSENELLNDICDIACDKAGYLLAWVGVPVHDETMSVHPVAQAGMGEYLEEVSITWSDEPRGRGPTGVAIRTGRIDYIQDWRTDERAIPWRETSLGRVCCSSIAIPLKGSGDIIGVLMLYSESPNEFNSQEIELLEEMADDLAYGIINIRAQKDVRKAEAALTESERRYRLLVDSAAEAIVVVQDDVFRLVNPITSVMTGYSEEELMSRPFLTFVHPDDRPIVEERYQRRLRGEPIPDRYTYRLIAKDDSVRWVAASAIVIDWVGRPATLKLLTDVTERNHAEEALHEANRKLNLLSSITRHDINNRLTVLAGNLELLSAKNLDPASERYLTKAKAALEGIAAQVRFTKEYQDVGVKTPAWQEVHGLVGMASGSLQADGVRVINDVPEGAEVFADPLITKVFSNLIDNAIRHGDGVSTIHFFLEESDRGIAIICQDDGKGIPAEMRSRLFSRGAGKDHGFGLFLSREILFITGITIEEKGEGREGARFVLSVPREGYRNTANSAS